MTQPPKYPSYPGDEPQQAPAGANPPPPGYQPPPPGYHPPPAPGYGTPPAPGYGPPPGQYPPGYYPPVAGFTLPPGVRLAGWWSRVGAYLVDALIVTVIVTVPMIIGAVIAFADTETDVYGEVTGVDPIGVVLMVLGGLGGLAFHLWNRGVRLGSRGQSLGKQLLGQRVVGVATGQPIGAGMGVLRLLLDYVFSNACFLNVLWPLWDDKKQTWHDMVVKTVVVTAA